MGNPSVANIICIIVIDFISVIDDYCTCNTNQCLPMHGTCVQVYTDLITGGYNHH